MNKSRKEVIEALELCPTSVCAGCPYYGLERCDIALAKDAIVCRGVDAEQEVGAENAFLTEYANKTGAVLIASGAVDYVAVPSEKRIL